MGIKCYECHSEYFKHDNEMLSDEQVVFGTPGHAFHMIEHNALRKLLPYPT